MHRVLCLMLTIGLVGALTSCNAGPLIEIKASPSDSGDTGGDGDGDGGTDNGGGNGGGGGTTTARFRGTWITSYGDDVVSATARIGFTHYAAFMNIGQDGTTLTGSGRMFRTYPSAASAQEEIPFTISGSTRGDYDAVITWQTKSSNAFEFNPTWRLRFANNTLVGMYEEVATGNAIARSGHATWSDADGDNAVNVSWASSFADGFDTDAFPARDRLITTSIEAPAGGNLGGGGLLIDQRPNDVPQEFNFEVLPVGEIVKPEISFTIGAQDLAETPIDWIGFYTANRLFSTYAQVNASGRAVRYGDAIWYVSPDSSGPDAIDGRWTTAFSDTNDAEGINPSDYLASVTLDAQDGGVVVGSLAQIFDQGRSNPQFRNFTLKDGTIFGKRVQFNLVANDVSFQWTIFVAGSTLVGTYTQINANGDFLSRGNAVWLKRNTNTSIAGAWTTSYFDTFETDSPRATQAARVIISNQSNQGILTGTGFLRFAAENSDRTFAVSGALNGETYDWVWGGAGLTGDTIWTLRRVSGGLYGVYENQNSVGTLESRGTAFWRETANPTN